MLIRALAALLLSATASLAAEDYTLVIQDHKFQPEMLAIPAGKKVKVTIRNNDPTEEEFESYDLDREQVVPGKGTAVIYLGPLKPGRYAFIGEVNPLTAGGTIVVKEDK